MSVNKAAENCSMPKSTLARHWQKTMQDGRWKNTLFSHFINTTAFKLFILNLWLSFKILATFVAAFWWTKEFVRTQYHTKHRKNDLTLELQIVEYFNVAVLFCILQFPVPFHVLVAK